MSGVIQHLSLIFFISIVFHNPIKKYNINIKKGSYHRSTNV